MLFGRVLHELYGELGSRYVVKLFWSDELLAELKRVHLRKGFSESRADIVNSYLRNAFPEGRVELNAIDGVSRRLVHDPDDAYLVQIAREIGGARLVTNNIRDFDVAGLLCEGVEVITPDQDLTELWGLTETHEFVVASAERQLERRRLNPEQLAEKLRGAQCGQLAAEISSTLGLS